MMKNYNKRKNRMWKKIQKNKFPQKCGNQNNSKIKLNTNKQTEVKTKKS